MHRFFGDDFEIKFQRQLAKQSLLGEYNAGLIRMQSLFNVFDSVDPLSLIFKWPDFWGISR